MHQDEYEDDEHNYDNNEDKYKHYFKFDPDAWDAWGKMLYDALDDLTGHSNNTWYVYGWSPKKFPVNSYFPNTDKDKKSFQYLGNNYQNTPIWKKKYFISNPIQSMYIDHLSDHAAYFVKQPHYYKGMFDILN